MELHHIELNQLKVSPINVRKNGDTSGDDLIPSIKAIGLIQPLLVRPNCEGYEVVAGQRRLSALQALNEEQSVDPVPCMVMDAKDDISAIEASLAENIARLPMDALDQFEAFHALVTQGMEIENIALHFGVTIRLVKQRLAIANLYQPIRNAYRREDIDDATLQILTMATARQQKQWFKLFKSENEYAPTGHQLKKWLFGGAQIPVSNALFDIEGFQGTIISDLFGEEQYFANPDQFWDCQNTAIAAMMEQYTQGGWSDVVLLEKGTYFSSWDYVDTSKKNGGRVYIRVGDDGEVTAYEGQLSRSEANRRLKAQQSNGASSEEEKPSRPELTKAMQDYLNLHRHAAVRTEILNHPQIALRLCVAQIIAGSDLWDVRADHQRTKSDDIAASLEANTAQSAFNKQRETILKKLGIAKAKKETRSSEQENVDQPLVDHRPYYGRGLDVHDLFAKLITLNNETVMEILTFTVAETLQSGSAMIEGLGAKLNVELPNSWQPDQAFFDRLRDKEAINAMLKDIAGKTIADANVTSIAKVQKQIIQDFANGTNGRKQNKDWRPRYVSFPMKAYTKRGGIEAITQFKAAKKHYCAA